MLLYRSRLFRFKAHPIALAWVGSLHCKKLSFSKKTNPHTKNIQYPNNKMQKLIKNTRGLAVVFF